MDFQGFFGNFWDFFLKSVRDFSELFTPRNEQSLESRKMDLAPFKTLKSSVTSGIVDVVSGSYRKDDVI